MRMLFWALVVVQRSIKITDAGFSSPVVAIVNTTSAAKVTLFVSQGARGEKGETGDIGPAGPMVSTWLNDCDDTT